MINFGALSILLIHRELLSDGKGLIRPVLYGISRGFAIRKEKGNIKGKENRMLKHSTCSKVWRLSRESFDTSNYLEAVRL
jgi:hypothetical protein